jgi:hypothetical protein
VGAGTGLTGSVFGVAGAVIVALAVVRSAIGVA